MRYLIAILCAAALSPCFADQIVPIGSSQLMVATGPNNARKIARTSADLRIVIYEDVAGDLNTIYMTYSADGVSWTGPLFIDFGLSPCIAVSDGDSFYVCYTKLNESIIKVMVFAPDDLPALAHARDIDIYYGSPSARHAFPVLDVGARFVHLAFQSRDVNAKSAIRYGLFHRNLDPATPLFTVSAADANAIRPTLQTDLEYGSDYVNLFWNEEQEAHTGIHHLSLDAAKLYASRPASQEDFWLLLEDLAHINSSFQQFAGCANASFSLRTRTAEDGSSYSNHIILGCDHRVQERFRLYSIDYTTDSENIDIRGGFWQIVSGPSWPSVDDVILNPRSCAVVWEENGNIYYGQSHYSDLEAEPLDISLTGASHYASVCYKTFRRDFFDVVWTYGQEPPFIICYRRLPKLYWFEPVQIDAESYITGAYLNYFNHIITARGGLNGALSVDLVDGQLPDGLLFETDGLDGHSWHIHGTPSKSGLYPITLRASDRGDDVGLMAEHKMTIRVENTAPTITILPDSLWWGGDKIHYSITLSDSQNNRIDWSVDGLPGWLELDKEAQAINGDAPTTGAVARFFVHASDGELTRTENVLVIVNRHSQVAEEIAIPTELTLCPAYPNPFNAQTIIKLALPTLQQVKIAIYDIRGRMVTTLHDGILDAGWHQFTFAAANLASGTFFIRMHAGDTVQMQKCILLR
ncbi:T9SS type A sorting domain-containing protein [candidate division KSB1 bacterium]|nr:T9SS type A sorting domain-containing protein [candidate division KSB1 bacterium]